MNSPTLENLMKHVESRYTLVVAASMRARELMSQQEKMVDYPKHKPVTIALKEIEEGKVTYRKLPSSGNGEENGSVL